MKLISAGECMLRLSMQVEEICEEMPPSAFDAIGWVAAARSRADALPARPETPPLQDR
jgi:hypothetical protein